MDEERMNPLAFHDLPLWAECLSLTAHLAAGIALGILYFRGLWWNTRLFASGGRVATTIALMAGRFILLGVVLAGASLEGALPLLTMALGILIARAAVMRLVRAAVP
jgi:F1F0 ATPase subunit 2